MAFHGRKDALCARLSRSRSTSHMLDSIRCSLGSGEDVMENTAHEQTDVSGVRELAEFLRTTGPPSRRSQSLEDCLRFPMSKTNRRWSMQSLKRNRRMKSRAQSTQLQLPDAAVPETTMDGHSYVALYTPFKHKHHGPWFRSQYPVFVPSGFPVRDGRHQGWPETTSSKETFGLMMNEETFTTGQGVSRQMASQRPSGSSRPKQGESSFSSRATPTSVSDGLEPDIDGQAAYSRSSSGLEICNEHCPPKNSNVPELPSINSNPKGIRVRQLHPPQYPSASKSLEHGIPKEIQAKLISKITTDPKEDEYPSVKPPSHEEVSLGTQARSLQDEVLLSAPRGISSPISPKPPPMAYRKPADMVVQSTLTVPNKESSLPESPGFPNMLAALTFPSPPRSSRSPSPTNSTNFPGPNQPSLGSGPLVQPRISSRRACTSLSVPTVSLNEIIMEPRRPSLRHVRSEYPSRTSNTPERCTGIIPVMEFAAPLDFDEAHCAQPCLYDSDAEAGRQAVSPAIFSSLTTNTRHRNSTSSNYEDDISSYRHSLISNSTLSTSLYWQSATTNDSYPRSTGSDVTELSAPATSAGVSFNSESADVSVVRPFSHPLSVANLKMGGYYRLSDPMGDTTSGEKAEALVEQLMISEAKKEEVQRSNTPPTVSTSLIRHKTQPRSTSIGGSQIARKNKVREYKLRDLDLSRPGRTTASFEPRLFESLDSPVLGWFPENALRPSKPSLQGSSPLAQDSYRPLTPDVTIVVNEILIPERRSTSGSPTEKRHEYSTGGPSRESQERRTHSRAPSNHWTVSPEMTIDIAPDYIASPPPFTIERLTISPIMVIANLESRPGSSTLRLPHLLRPDSPAPHLPPRSALRPKSLKIIPQPRQKSYPITIARNPSTGVIERTTATNYRLNRRSLTNMPTPPLSPEPGQSSGRMSLPPEYTHQEKSQIPEGLASNLQGQKPEQVIRWRSAALKERVLREKLEKEKEISDIVAKTLGSSHKGKGDSEVLSRHQENHTTQSIERRLQRLERNGDAWLRAMKPFLENMAKTLEDMRQDGVSGSLTMSEFNIDMEAEARRFSCYNHQVRQGESVSQPGPTKDFDAEKVPRCPEHLQRQEEKVLTPTYLQQQSGPQTDTIEEQETEKMTNDVGEKVDSRPARLLTETISRSLQEHELEAQAAVKRRLLQQEAMMSNLLSRWGLPSPRVPGSGDVTAPADNERKLPTASRPRRRPIDATGERSREYGGDSETYEELLKEECGDNSEVEDLDPLIAELRRAPWPQRLDRSSDGDL